MSINLQKGERISLEKDGDTLTKLQIGVNWGAITKQGVFGKKTVAVDLDASIGLFDASGILVDTVSFRQLKSRCGSVVHSGDDRVGDTDGDDGEDNETILVDLAKLPEQVETLGVVLNSFKQQDFAEIPFARVRILDGRNQNVFARFDIARDETFAGKVSMIMGAVYKKAGVWKFRPIGEGTKDRRLEETLNTFARDYIR